MVAAVFNTKHPGRDRPWRQWIVAASSKVYNNDVQEFERQTDTNDCRLSAHRDRPVPTRRRESRFWLRLQCWVWGACRLPIICLASSRVVIHGTSMQPNLRPNDYVLVNQRVYTMEAPERGDVVVLHDPSSPRSACVKRVVGLPGEHIRLDKGRAFINDLLLPEPYVLMLPSNQHQDTSEWYLGAAYFVLGDDRSDSRDSRYFGPVPIHEFIGRVWARYWPLNAWGCIHRPSYSLG